MLRAAIYARYSTELQNPTSITDQFALCRKYAADHNLAVVEEFSDPEMSGREILSRPGAMAMLNSVKLKPKPFDVVIVEDLNRLSRDDADLPWAGKILTAFDVDLHSATQGGRVDPIVLPVYGMVGRMQAASTANNVRRNHNGLVSRGLAVGAINYGYRAAPVDVTVNVTGKGGRAIYEPEADVVRRIFLDYVNGSSPGAIARCLNDEGIPNPSRIEERKGPKCRVSPGWSKQMVMKMLCNPIYAGRIVRNKQKNFREPGAVDRRGRPTNQPRKRAAPVGDIMTAEASHLRIIDEATWQAAEAIRAKRATVKFSPDGKVQRRNHGATSDALLSGLLRCGVCGGHMPIVSGRGNGERRVACVNARLNKNVCSHTRTYDMEKLRLGFLAHGREILARPEYIERTLKSFQTNLAEGLRIADAERGELRKRKNTIEGQINRYVEAIATAPSVHSLAEKLASLEAERARVEQRLLFLDARTRVVDLHPRNINRLVKDMDWLFGALLNSDSRGDKATRAAFHNLFHSVEVMPVPPRAPYEFRPYARINAFTGAALKVETRPLKKVIEDEGVTMFGKRNSEVPGLPKTNITPSCLSASRNARFPDMNGMSNSVVCLGTWRAAA